VCLSPKYFNAVFPSFVDRYRVDANQDPDPTFHFNVTPDSDPDRKLENQIFILFYILGNASLHCARCHNFQYFGQNFEIY
jgi:hypothetical protein